MSFWLCVHLFFLRIKSIRSEYRGALSTVYGHRSTETNLMYCFHSIILVWFGFYQKLQPQFVDTNELEQTLIISLLLIADRWPTTILPTLLWGYFRTIQIVSIICVRVLNKSIKWIQIEVRLLRLRVLRVFCVQNSVDYTCLGI